MDCQRRRKAGGAELHRGVRIQAVRDRHYVFGGDARHAGVATVTHLAHAGTVDQHRLSFVQLGILGRYDDASQIDAADQRIASQDWRSPGRGQRVLVVDCRMADANNDVAFGQVIELEFAKLAADAVAILVDAKRLKGIRHGICPVLDGLRWSGGVSVPEMPSSGRASALRPIAFNRRSIAISSCSAGSGRVTPWSRSSRVK